MMPTGRCFHAGFLRVDISLTSTVLSGGLCLGTSRRVQQSSSTWARFYWYLSRFLLERKRIDFAVDLNILYHVYM